MNDYIGSNRTAAMFISMTIVVLEIVGLFLTIAQNGAEDALSYEYFANAIGMIASFALMVSEALTQRGMNELDHYRPRPIKGKGSKSSDARIYDEIRARHRKRETVVHKMRFVAAVLFLSSPCAGFVSVALGEGNPFKSFGFIFLIVVPIISTLSYIYLEPGDKPSLALYAVVTVIALALGCALISVKAGAITAVITLVLAFLLQKLNEHKAG